MLEQLTSHFPWLKSVGGYAGVAALITCLPLIISGWRNIVGFIRAVGDFFVIRMVIKDEGAKAMIAYINSFGKRSPFGLRVFSGNRVYINPLKRVEVVAHEGMSSERSLVRIGKRFLMFGLKSDKDETAIGDYTYDSPVVRIFTIRGMFNLEQLVIDATEYYNSLHRSIEDNYDTYNGDKAVKRFKVVRFGRKPIINNNPNELSKPSHAVNHEIDIRTKTVRLLKWQINDIGMVAGKNTAFNVYFFPEDVMTAVEEVRSWIKNENWYKDKGINWRLGWLLHGKPGTGKSTLIRSVAMEFDLPVYILDLSSLDNNTFTDAWQEIQQNSPAIALIEDIDNVFHGRTNITAKELGDSLTFDCLLNTISGVNNSDGVFLAITTNELTELDHAIGVPEPGSTRSTRPGRIDRIIELKEMRVEERTKVANYILAEYPEYIQPTIAAGEGESAAQFQDRCTKLALSLFWENQKQQLPVKTN